MLCISISCLLECWPEIHQKMLGLAENEFWPHLAHAEQGTWWGTGGPQHHHLILGRAGGRRGDPILPV